MPVEVVEEHRVLVDGETRRVPAHDALLGRGACVQLIHGSMELHIDSNLRQEYESVWVSQAREREIASDRDIIRGVKISREIERETSSPSLWGTGKLDRISTMPSAVVRPSKVPMTRSPFLLLRA